jgi:TMEM175 potassium channel family protein
LVVVAQEGTVGGVRPEGEESAETDDNSLGRLLTISDGVFAIAMTLLTLDLKVPNLGRHPSDAVLRHALSKNTASYLSFLVSFYVVANYWNRHRRLMRSVVTTHPRLITHTIFLLLVVAAMPFLASLLGQYGGTPIALALYGAFNAVAVVTLLLLRRDIEHRNLAPSAQTTEGAQPSWEPVHNLLVFVLCIPAGYVFGRNGPWVLVLLAVPVVPIWRQLRRRRDQRRTASQLRP